LATDSFGVEKVQENGLFGYPGAVLGLGQITQPADIQGHEEFLLFQGRGAARAGGWSKHNHSPWKGKRWTEHPAAPPGGIEV
jgi:hypothetical protein